MFQMCGVFAEFERGMIRERVNAGLARARERGTKLGRRPVVSGGAYWDLFVFVNGALPRVMPSTSA
jgi:DNA invertase Pin-like site-specific DNA recombinase